MPRSPRTLPSRAGGTSPALKARAKMPRTALSATATAIRLQNGDASRGGFALPSPIDPPIVGIDTVLAPLVDDGGNIVFNDVDSLARQRSSSPLSSRPSKRARKRSPSIPVPSYNVVVSPEKPIEESIGDDQTVETELDFSMWTTVFDSPMPAHIESFTTKNVNVSHVAPQPASLHHGNSLSESQNQIIIQTTMVLLCNPGVLAALMVYFNSTDIVHTMQTFHFSRVNITQEAILGNPTYNLPDAHPIFANIVRLIPLRLRECKSRLINAFTARRMDFADRIYRQADVLTIPPSTAFLGAASGIHPSIPSYPLTILDKYGKPTPIDNKDYYVGRYAAPFKLACNKFLCHLIGEIPLPEIFERIDFMLNRLVRTLIQCILDAFEELGYVSYEDKVFRIVHFNGMLLAVWESRIDFRNYLKRATRGAALHVFNYSLTPEIRGSETRTTQHKNFCQVDAFNKAVSRNYVEPIESESGIQCDYTNELFFHAIMKGLFLDDNKIGRLFRSFFRNGIPIPTVAFFATSFLNTFEEFMIDGSVGGVDLSPEPYFPEFQYHLMRLNDLLASEIYGPLLRATLLDWAIVGCSNEHSGRRTVQRLKVDLKKLRMHKASMRNNIPTFTSVFSTKFAGSTS